MPRIQIDATCPLCLSSKKKNVKLKLFRMNFSEGAILCSSKNCPYPFVEDGMDNFVKLHAPPDIDLSVDTDASFGDSWSSVLEQVNKIITPPNESGDIIKQADKATNNSDQENNFEEFSSYASDFIDLFLKECEVKYSKSNEVPSEPLCNVLENNSMNSSILEFDLNLSSLSISTTPGEAVGSFDALPDCFDDFDMQTESSKREEANSRKNCTTIFDKKNALLENNSKTDNNKNNANMIRNSDMQINRAEREETDSRNKSIVNFELKNTVFESNSKNTNNKDNVGVIKIADISQNPNGINEQQSNSQFESIQKNTKLTSISSDAPSNIMDSQEDLDSVHSNEVSTCKTLELSHGICKTISDIKGVETIPAAIDIQSDKLNKELLPAGNCALNNEAIVCEELEFIYLPEDTHLPTDPENSPILVKPDEIHQDNSIFIILNSNGSSSVVQVGEVGSIVDGMKQGIADSSGLMKDQQKELDVSEADNIAHALNQENICDIVSATKQGNICDNNGHVIDQQKVLDVSETDNIAHAMNQENIFDIVGAIKQVNISDSNPHVKDQQKVLDVGEADNIAHAMNQENMCDNVGAIKEGNLSDSIGHMKDQQKVLAVSEADNIAHAMNQENICDIVGAIKQGNISDSNGLLKDQQKVLDDGEVDDSAHAIIRGNICDTKSQVPDVSIQCSPKINSNTDALAASVQNCEDQSPTEKDVSRLLNLNKLSEAEINYSLMNPPTGTEKPKDLSECKSLQDCSDFRPLSECCKENVSSSSVENKTSCKTNNKTNCRITKNIKDSPPKVLFKSQMCTRSSTRKQRTSKKSDCKKCASETVTELNIYKKIYNTRIRRNIISQPPKDIIHCDPDTTANIDYKNDDKSGNTLDLPFKHISDAVVSVGSTFSFEQSRFSLVLDDLELSPVKIEICPAHNRYSMLAAKAGVKDSFLSRNRNRRRSKRTIKKSSPDTSIICLDGKVDEKTVGSNTSDELRLSSNMYDYSIGKRVERMTRNHDTKNFSARIQDEFVAKKKSRTNGVDRRRNQSARNNKESSPIAKTFSICLNNKKEIKTKEPDTHNELSSLFTNNSIYKPAVKMTRNSYMNKKSAR